MIRYVTLCALLSGLLIGAPAFGFDKTDKIGGKGGPKSGSRMAMGKDGGDKGDKGGGKKRMTMSGMHKDGGDKGDKGDKGGGKKSQGMSRLSMSKDGGDKGDKGGKDGGKKGIIGPSDSQALKGQQGLAPTQMDRGMDAGTAGMERMERSVDGINR